MRLIGKAYTLEEVLYLSNFSLDAIRFGEPDCFFKTKKNWDIKNIEKAINVLTQTNIIPQFQFIYSPTDEEALIYLRRISKKFPDLEIAIENYGFLDKIKNKKITGNGIKTLNSQSLKIFKKLNCTSLILPEYFSSLDILKLNKIIKKEDLQIDLEYCFFGRKRLLSSWQCFSKRFDAQNKTKDKDCNFFCEKNNLLFENNDNLEVKFFISGNCVLSFTPEDKIEKIKEYIESGITNILLDFKFENRQNIEQIISNTKKYL